jgi:hypothetical protein
VKKVKFWSEGLFDEEAMHNEAAAIEYLALGNGMCATSGAFMPF